MHRHVKNVHMCTWHTCPVHHWSYNFELPQMLVHNFSVRWQIRKLENGMFFWHVPSEKGMWKCCAAVTYPAHPMHTVHQGLEWATLSWHDCSTSTAPVVRLLYLRCIFEQLRRLSSHLLRRCDDIHTRMQTYTHRIHLDILTQSVLCTMLGESAVQQSHTADSLCVKSTPG